MMRVPAEPRALLVFSMYAEQGTRSDISLLCCLLYVLSMLLFILTSPVIGRMPVGD